MRPSLLRRIEQVRRLPSPARTDLLRAQFALVRAQLALRLGRRGSLLSATNAATPSSGDPAGIPRARELAIAVRRVAEHGPIRAHCLARAMALSSLLRQAGLHGSMIRVGVTMRDGRLIAHAWVEFAGTKLVDSAAEVRDLREVEGLQVSPGP